MNIDKHGINNIDKENWKEATGVKCTKNSTNSLLTGRDYDIPCYSPHKIGVIKGYWIWWCSTHHQPLSHCDYQNLRINIKNKVLDFAEEVIK